LYIRPNNFERMKMKFSKTILSIFFIIGFICSLHAAKLRFRSGNILAAELSSATPSINNFNKDAFPNLPEQKVCAVITIQLDKSRKISILIIHSMPPAATIPVSHLPKTPILNMAWKQWKTPENRSNCSLSLTADFQANHRRKNCC